MFMFTFTRLKRLSSLAALASLALLPRAAAAQAELFAVVAAEGEGTPGTPSGLVLSAETVRVSIDAQYAKTTLKQVFRNSSPHRLEGNYRLQVGEGAAVSGFAYWNGEQKIVGEVFEKQEATQIYEDVTGLGRDPGLAEHAGEGAFSFRVFPIEPGENKRVEVTYGRWLRRAGNFIEYRVPLGASQSPVEVEIDLSDERGLSEITSATHRLTIDQTSQSRAVIRAQGKHPLGGELALRYRISAPDWQLSAWIHRDAGHDAYLIAALATPGSVAHSTVAPKDITLVLDRSGSMSGQPLEQAKEAAKAVIQRITGHDRINVIAFDDDVDLLFAAPQPITEDVRAQALDYVAALTDGGGTNLALALERALLAQIAPEAAEPGKPGESRPAVILFLTDGQSDAQATLKVAQADKGDVRVFTIGVGSGVEKPLLSRLAAVKRGRFTFIDSPSAIEPSVSRLYSQIAAPVMVDVSLTAMAGSRAAPGEATKPGQTPATNMGLRLARQYPRTLPDLFRDDELVIAARLDAIADAAGPITLTVAGEVGGKRVSLTRTMVLPKQVTRPWVGRLWAKARIDDLLEEIALSGETEELKTEVIELGVAYNFASPYTSFLAIPDRELTDEARTMLGAARERKQRILAAHKDAVALSRTAMPPGDPILQVRAPANAKQVTAYFPFGLVKDLTYDADTEHWRVRFLVPKDVPDGEYLVKLIIVHIDGTVEVAHVPYTIDSAAPDIDVSIEPVPGGARITVIAPDEGSLVTAAWVADPGQRIELSAPSSSDPLVLQGILPLKAGIHDIRIVVADRARNEADAVVRVEVLE